MRAITLYQPWASLIAEGYKRNETRGRRPPEAAIGERLAIHAGLNRRYVYETKWSLFGGTKYKGPITNYKGPMWKLFLKELGFCMGDDYEYPYGAIVAVVTLGKPRPAGTLAMGLLMESFGERPISGREEIFGDYGFGRWAWPLEDVEKLVNPMPARGYQYVWAVKGDQLEQLEAAPKLKVAVGP